MELPSSLQERIVNNLKTTLTAAKVIVAGLSTSVLFTLSTPAHAGANDASEGMCDGFRGQERSLCIRAHVASRKVDKLEAKGSTNKAYDNAVAKLDSMKEQFLALTGSQVPGLGAICNIEEINVWLARAQEKDWLDTDVNVVSQDVPGQCSVYFDVTAAHQEEYYCSNRATIDIVDNVGYGRLDLVIALDGYEGMVVEPGQVRTCTRNFVITKFGEQPASPDSASLRACAISLGCESF